MGGRLRIEKNCRCTWGLIPTLAVVAVTVLHPVVIACAVLVLIPLSPSSFPLVVVHRSPVVLVLVPPSSSLFGCSHLIAARVVAHRGRCWWCWPRCHRCCRFLRLLQPSLLWLSFPVDTS